MKYGSSYVLKDFPRRMQRNAQDTSASANLAAQESRENHAGLPSIAQESLLGSHAGMCRMNGIPPVAQLVPHRSQSFQLRFHPDDPLN